MKRQLPVGLVVEGNATNSAVLRLPGLGDHIGPVKSSTLRVARRFTNALRAGRAVDAYEELDETRLILLRVPDASLSRIVDQFCVAELDLGSMCFAVCETWQASDCIAPLRAHGAAVATISALPGSGARWFITEGDKPALRQVRGLLELTGARVIALRQGTKPLYFAAEHLATVVPLPLLNTAQLALREAGISGRILTSVLERLAQRLVKNFRAGNRLTPAGPFQDAELGYTDAQLAELQSKFPEIAGILSNTFQQFPAPALRVRRTRNSGQGR